MVETRIIEEPDFRNEVELTAALRDGLRELQRRGEIAPLLSHRHALWRHQRSALAAAVGIVALGIASFQFFQRPDQASETTAIASLRFERTRTAGMGPDVVWQHSAAPTKLQMRFDVGLEPAATYHVAIERLTEGAVVSVFNGLASVSADGEAVMIVDAAMFGPGDYRITLHPHAPATAAEPINYALRIADRS